MKMSYHDDSDQKDQGYRYYRGISMITKPYQVHINIKDVINNKSISNDPIHN